MLIKENSELKHMVLDVCQKIQPITNTINSHNVNSNNNKIIVESMGGSGDNDTEKENKIIKNIAKVVIIDKNI
jgi:hypothetical protein